MYSQEKFTMKNNRVLTLILLVTVAFTLFVTVRTLPAYASKSAATAAPVAETARSQMPISGTMPMGQADMASMMSMMMQMMGSMHGMMGQMAGSQNVMTGTIPMTGAMPMDPGGMSQMMPMMMPMMMAMHQTMMGGMELTTPSGASIPFDAQFIDSMLQHHQDAIDMAEEVQAKAEHDELKRLADAIIAAQSAEIEQMTAWRQAWYPDLPSTEGMDMAMGDTMIMMGIMMQMMGHMQNMAGHMGGMGGMGMMPGMMGSTTMMSNTMPMHQMDTANMMAMMGMMMQMMGHMQAMSADDDIMSSLSTPVMTPEATVGHETASDLTHEAQAGAILVKAIPLNLHDTAAERLDFQVVLETHSVDLNFDLGNMTLLRAGNEELAPVAWTPSASGGHHVTGILSFPATTADGEPVHTAASEVTMVITGLPDAEDLSFTWDIAQP
jgi:uncharacterized protein (DUF305 family)